MASASNSCAREKLASASFDLASASAPASGSLTTSVKTRLRRSARRACFLADLGVVGDHMAHLVRQHGGKLGFVVGERDQAAGHVELAGRQRKGVDRLRIEHRDVVVQVGPLGRRDQPLDGLLDHGLQPRIVVDAAIGREDALVLAQHRGRQRGGIGRLRAVATAKNLRRRRPAATAVQAASTERRKCDARAGKPIAADPNVVRPSAHHVTRMSLAVVQLDLLRMRGLDPRTARRTAALLRSSRGPGRAGPPGPSNRGPPP